MNNSRWEFRKGDSISADISYWKDYVISHRPGCHILSYRPKGQHHHIGDFATAEEAKSAAQNHNPKN